MAAGKHSHPRYFTPTGGTPIPTAADCTVSSPAVPSDNCAMAGYQATGRTFRFAQALITVPNHVGVVDPDSSSTEPGPAMYVALDNSSSATYEFARVGIAPCPTGTTVAIVPDQSSLTSCGSNASGWVAFAAVQQPTGTVTIDTNKLSTAVEGDGVLVNAYLEPTGNAVHFTITLPDGPVHRAGRAAGHLRGPWALNAFEGTSNDALPPAGTLVVQPSYLWNDGTNLHGWFGDAFGVWRFSS